MTMSHLGTKTINAKRENMKPTVILFVLMIVLFLKLGIMVFNAYIFNSRFHRQMSLPETKSPGWVRVAQIGLGIIAIILSLYVLAFPVIAFISVVYVLAIVLFVLAIERIIVGVFIPTPGTSRWGTVGLGIIVLIVSLIVIAFPVGTTVFLIFLLGVALFFDGIARIVHGIGDKSSSKGSRIFGIIAGVIAIGLSIMVFVSPGTGRCYLGNIIGDSPANKWYPDHSSRCHWQAADSIDRKVESQDHVQKHIFIKKPLGGKNSTLTFFFIGNGNNQPNNGKERIYHSFHFFTFSQIQ